MSDRTQVNLRLDADLLAALDELGFYEHLDRPELTRRILREGVARHREERAVQEYANGRVTAWRAAEMAGISLYDMLDLIHQRGIVHDVDPDELEQIRRLPVPPGAPPEGTASEQERRRVAESSNAYGSDQLSPTPRDAESGIDELRGRYRPSDVRTLMVGESSPAGGTHFYLANSNLFRAVREAFVAALGDGVPSGEAFLAYFADAGYWLVDVADAPVNKMSDALRRQTVTAGAARLRTTIEQTRPDAIVAVKASVGEVVRHAAQSAGSTAPVDVLPFPVRQWRAAFVKELAALIARSTETRGRAAEERAIASANSVATDVVLTQRVTEADLRRGQIRIPSTGRGKSFFPAVRGRIGVVLRGHGVDASYDPHYDPDQQRSGVIRVGRELASLVEAEEHLRIGRLPDGVVTLD